MIVIKKARLQESPKESITMRINMSAVIYSSSLHKKIIIKGA